MELPIEKFQTIKLSVHLAQAALIALSWCLEIAVFHKGSIDGKSGWYFGLCFLSIPAIIYLTMTPRFPRVHKFANPYAFASVDGLFCLFWISAFAAQASFNSSGKCGKGCTVSKVVVACGVFIWLLFALSTAMSVYGIIYFRREGYLPGASRAPNNASLIDPDKDAFSTNPHDEYAPVHDTDDHDIHFSGGESSQIGGGLGGPPGYDNGYGGGGGYEPPQGYTEDTGYGGAQSVGGIAPGAYAPPHVQDEDDAYGSHGGRVQFPDARYGNV